MATKVDQGNCESCQILLKQPKPEELRTCEFCGHLFRDKCTCSSAESMSNLVAMLKKYGLIIACF